MPERDFKLPDLGEGLTEGEVVRWLVKEGDTVTLNQPVVEVETAKAVVEIPAPYAGKVTKLHEVLANSLYDFSRQIIERVQLVRSHEVELMQLNQGGIRVASYLTELPPKAVLEKRLRSAAELARKRLGERPHE